MQLIAMLAPLAFTVFAIYGCYSLLKSAQLREDADDKRLWEHLLDRG
jgi:hypothetical protein